MKRTVYIETSIPSFFYTTRSDPLSVARKLSTERWWREEQPWYELYTSVYALLELRAGDYPSKSSAIELMNGITLLESVPEIEETVWIYVKHKLMPERDLNDAFHVAVASHYGIHFLLTWNCRHLANANKTEHLRKINHELGLYVPIITTPDNMFFIEDDDND
jgi:predicted nucleic acid-binding protein